MLDVKMLISVISVRLPSKSIRCFGKIILTCQFSVKISMPAISKEAFVYTYTCYHD